MTLNKIYKELEERLNYLKVKRGNLITIEIPHSEYVKKYKEYSLEIETIYNMINEYKKNF